jgi:hypothetical protein
MTAHPQLTKVFTTYLQFCPFCQAPFGDGNAAESTTGRGGGGGGQDDGGAGSAALSAHVESCLTEHTKPAFECSLGVACNKVDPRHFKAFAHAVLAEARAREPPIRTSRSNIDESGAGAATKGVGGAAVGPSTAGLTLSAAAAIGGGSSLVSRSVKAFCNYFSAKIPAAPPPLLATGANTGGGGGGGVYGRGRRGGPPPPCPFYKKMPGTPFTVDAFRYGNVAGCGAYFLTHFHADHYGGLSKKFQGKIYCNEGTANLVEAQLKVSRELLYVLPMDQPTMVMGVEVTLLDANHCPGAAVILFKLPTGKVYLHTGDFRASPALAQNPLLGSRRIDVLYLDTTYCNPQYKFPEQQKTLDYIALTSKQLMAKKPGTLIVVGTYGIGKEKVFMAIAKALGVKACVEPRKMQMLRLVAPEL